MDLIFANLTLSADMQKSSPLVPALQSNWLMMHVSMMMLSYATLIIGSLLCILFLVLSKLKMLIHQLIVNQHLVILKEQEIKIHNNEPIINVA